MELVRIICESENCNKSTYTVYPELVKKCPYCGHGDVRPYAGKDKYVLFVNRPGQARAR